jgi:hypothetical protein
MIAQLAQNRRIWPWQEEGAWPLRSEQALLLPRLVATTSFVAYEDDLRSVKQHLNKLEAQLQQTQKRLEAIRKKRQQKEKRSKPR